MAFSVASVMVQMLLFAAAATPSSHRSQSKHQRTPLAANLLHASKSVPIWWPVGWKLRRHSGLGAVLCGWSDQWSTLYCQSEAGTVGLFMCQIWRYVSNQRWVFDRWRLCNWTDHQVFSLLFLFWFHWGFIAPNCSYIADNSPPFTSSHVTE